MGYTRRAWKSATVLWKLVKLMEPWLPGYVTIYLSAGEVYIGCVEVERAYG